MLILETYINVFNNSDKQEYIDIVWDMLQTAYASIGGFKSVSNKDELMDNLYTWKLTINENKVVALGIYKKQHGRKCIGLATDGTPSGKSQLINMIKEDIQSGKSWLEASGCIEHIFNKHNAKKLPNKFAAIATGKQILELDPDGFHYVREIAGEKHRKIIFGSVEGI